MSSIQDDSTVKNCLVSRPPYVLLACIMVYITFYRL